MEKNNSVSGAPRKKMALSTLSMVRITPPAPKKKPKRSAIAAMKVTEKLNGDAWKALSVAVHKQHLNSVVGMVCPDFNAMKEGGKKGLKRRRAANRKKSNSKEVSYGHDVHQQWTNSKSSKVFIQMFWTILKFSNVCKKFVVK